MIHDNNRYLVVKLIIEQKEMKEEIISDLVFAGLCVLIEITTST